VIPALLNSTNFALISSFLNQKTMINHLRNHLGKVLMLTLAVIVSVQSSNAQKVPDNIADNIHFRSIGPTRQGGRYVEFSVVEKATKVIYAATASGGLWKTTNNGISWNSIFDNENIISIGAVEVDQRDTSVVWVGTGEANNSRSAYYGNGIYKSTNGGKTWTNMGLPNSGHIGRIRVDPKNSNTVYVAALGHLYSDNAERGVYKTTDGGKTWNKVLAIKRDDGKDIGVVDLAMSPSNSNVLFAAAYDKIRTPWTFNEGGHGSGIYKSTNGGRTWSKLEGGLPGGHLGRIGIDIAPGNANVIYANIENVNVEGISFEERKNMLEIGIPLGRRQRVVGTEVYRSSNGGKTWTKASPDGENIGGGPGYYYQQIRVDPNDADHVYVIGQRMFETKDAGKTWGSPFRFGGDNHAMWIDPADSQHMLLGYDHGMGVTYDGGKSWYHPDEIPLAQFYAVDVDMAQPYNVYGGLQDNGSVKGPSSKRNGSIGLEDWARVGGGDGMFNAVDRTNNRFLYNESQFAPIRRLDMLTGESTAIKSKNHSRTSEMRWNWNSPIIVSAHDSDVIYHAGNKVLRSNYRGDSWEEISDDLTDADSVKIMGTGNIQYGTITALEESPINPDELWAGSDDGNVHVTVDGGKTWTNVNDNVPNNPRYWVSRIEASAHNAGTAYLTYTGLRRDDFNPFVYKTTDFGKTWTSISNGLPAGPVNVIREDHKNPNLLFLGTDIASYVSIDGGANWSKFNDLPTTPAYDMVIHPRENELVMASHGRGIFIADISALQGLTSDVMNKTSHLFDIQAKVKWVNGLSNTSPSRNYNGESASRAVNINFYAKSGGKATVNVYKGSRMVYNMEVDASAGLNTVNWNMEQIVRERNDREMRAIERQMERFRSFGFDDAQIAARFGNTKYLTAPAGEGDYTVVFEMNGQSMTKTASVLRDDWFDKE
jgi:photosystem II stability/assembly factor-like uncharacterized protein